jgi:hypothetical protein
MSKKITRYGRTGLRKPTHYLKAWENTRITPRLRVAVVDEWLHEGRRKARKSWFIALTQNPDTLKKCGPVKGAPEATTLLFEDDVVALVNWLLSLGQIAFDKDGNAVNEDAELWKTMPPIKSKTKAEKARWRQERRQLIKEMGMLPSRKEAARLPCVTGKRSRSHGA